MTSAFWRQNILENLHSKCSTPLHSWSDSPIGCSAPLYSRSGSLIGSAYSFLYINSCFRFNKSLTNLTSLRQHHLQYKKFTKSFVNASLHRICQLFRKSNTWLKQRGNKLTEMQMQQQFIFKPFSLSPLFFASKWNSAL